MFPRMIRVQSMAATEKVSKLCEDDAIARGKKSGFGLTVYATSASYNPDGVPQLGQDCQDPNE